MTAAFPEQRRSHYRLLTQAVEPLSCFIAVQGEEMDIDLVDLSVAGIGILGYLPGLLLQPGQVWRNIRIELPQVGTLCSDVEIRSAQDVTLRNGIRTVRTGAQFLAPSSTLQNMVQRYILQAERKRLSLLQDAGR